MLLQWSADKAGGCRLGSSNRRPTAAANYEANSSSKLRGLQQTTRLAAAYSRLQGLRQHTAGYKAYSSTQQTKRPTSAEVRAEVRVFRSEERSRGGEINFSPPLTLSCCGVFCIINHLHHDIMMSLLLGRPRVHEIKSSPLVNHVLVRSRVRPSSHSDIKKSMAPKMVVDPTVGRTPAKILTYGRRPQPRSS